MQTYKTEQKFEFLFHISLQVFVAIYHMHRALERILVVQINQRVTTSQSIQIDMIFQYHEIANFELKIINL